MSSMLYGAMAAKREAAPRGQSTEESPPGVKTYVDALAALVPAEVLGLHAVIITFCTQTSKGTGVTRITEWTALKGAFWALLVLAPLLFVVGRWRAAAPGVQSPSRPITALQALIPGVAFVAWTMLLRPSAFDAVDSGLATGARDTIAVIAAVVLGVVAAQLGYRLDGSDPMPHDGVARGRRSAGPDARTEVYANQKRHVEPARLADGIVNQIAHHKAVMLVLSLALAVVLALVAAVDLSLGDGPSLTHSVVDIGGYVAIVGLVLGLPALGYAMVTDSGVERLRDAIGVTDEGLGALKHEIKERIEQLLRTRSTQLPEDHHVQIFIPNLHQTRLLPVYDLHNEGPGDGWEIIPGAPQAVTGSAWEANEYFFALGDALSDPVLRLTPAQLRRFRRLTGVAAAPIRDQDEHIGVLTIYTDSKVPQMDDPAFIRLHLALADALSPAVSEYVAARGTLAKASHQDYKAIAPDKASGRTSGRVRPTRARRHPRAHRLGVNGLMSTLRQRLHSARANWLHPHGNT
jgi:hypothetical protein